MCVCACARTRVCVCVCACARTRVYVCAGVHAHIIHELTALSIHARVLVPGYLSPWHVLYKHISCYVIKE